MNIRLLLFKVYDLTKGGKINHHLKEIKMNFSDKQIQNDKLNDLLEYAIKNVPFYKNQQIEPTLTDFPIVDKIILRNSQHSFISNEFVKSELLSMTTSGSTGTPFTVYQDRNKKNRNYADTLFFEELGGYELGHRLLYLKIWSKQKMAPAYRYKIQNILPIDVLHLNDEKIKDMLNDLKNNTKQTHAILGYVSALEEIIRYCERKYISKINGDFSGVITMSEGLNAVTKHKLEKLFGCSVVSRYSNIENGILAQQEPYKQKFLFNTASYFVEILHPDKDEVLNDGELGRIVITDLYNRGMPLIRYDTGDFGIRETANGKIYLTAVEGRKLDLLFDTAGNTVSSYIMYKNMWQYTEISQYQLIQTGEKSYKFKINCSEEFKREKQLISEFKSYLGLDADFQIVYVDEIPLLDSGKRRKTVNLYRKEILK